MRNLAVPVQTLYAELLERCQVQALDEQFGSGGNFVKLRHGSRSYWYFQEDRGHSTHPSRRRYVGPDSAELQQTVRQHGQRKSAYRERRQLTAALKRAGAAGPDPLTGTILHGLASAGVFRLRACVVGTVAFQAYAGILGVKLPGAMTRTQDLDLARDFGVAVAIAEQETVGPVLSILRGIDGSFREVPRLRAAGSGIYVSDSDYRVEVLTTNRGRERDRASLLPSIGAFAHPLRYMDFLVRGAVPAVALHKAGTLINVPTPERYAVHKLIVSQRRRAESAKIEKDLAQAGTLLDVLVQRRPEALRRVWREAERRGDGWRRPMEAALARLHQELQAAVHGLIARRRRVRRGAPTGI